MTEGDIRRFNRAYRFNHDCGDDLLVAKPRPDLALRVANTLVHDIAPVVLKGSPDSLKDILEAPIITSPNAAATAFHALYRIHQPHEFISGLCGALALLSSPVTKPDMTRISWFLGRTCRFGGDIISDSLVSSFFIEINKEQKCDSALILN